MLNRLQALLFSRERRGAWIVLALICIAAGVLAGAYVAVLTPVLALAVGLALVAALLMLRDTQWGFVAVIAVACLLPFGALPIDIGFRPTFLDVVLLALFGVWAMGYAGGRRRDLRLSPLGGFVLLFIGLACASFVAGMAHSRPTSYVIRHFAEILLAIALFFVVVDTVRTTPRLRQLAQMLALAGTAQAGLGVFLYVIPQSWSIRLLSALGRFNYPTGSGVLRFVEDDPEGLMRAVGTSIDPNVLGGLMVLIGGLLGAQLFSRRPLFPRVMSWGMLGLVGLCLYLTYSRAAMLGLAVGLLFLGVSRYRKLLIVMVAAGALILLLPQTQDYVLRFVEGLQGADQATQMRFGEYKDAFILISRYPWFGVGFAGTPDIDTYLGVSSAYLLMAEQMGLVGVGAFLLTVVRYLFYTLGVMKRRLISEEMEPCLWGLVAGLSGALVAGVLDHYFFNFDFPHSVSLFWLFLGLGTAAAQIVRGEAAQNEPA